MKTCRPGSNCPPASMVLPALLAASQRWLHSLPALPALPAALWPSPARRCAANARQANTLQRKGACALALALAAAVDLLLAC